MGMADRRKRPRGILTAPMPSWFASLRLSDNQAALLTDLIYIRMLQSRIFTVENERFALHKQIVGPRRQDNTPLTDRAILAYLLSQALKDYAEAEQTWIRKDPGELARAFQKTATLAQDFQRTLGDGGKLRRALTVAARRVQLHWTEPGAIARAFLLARRRLLRNVRLICEELAELRDYGANQIITRLSANLLAAFAIRTHRGQSVDQLIHIVRNDKGR
jgi:hypothetical protein